MKLSPLLICGYLFLMPSCKDTQIGSCESLEADLLELNVAHVKAELDPWLSGLFPAPSAGDLIGHGDNLQSFTDRLQDDCDLDANLVCYGCIETYPLQSEISLWIDSSGLTVRRVLDILTPDSEVMAVVNIHF